MAFTPFNGSGGGSGSDDCTATTAQWRSGYTAIGLGTDDEPANGSIQDYSGTTAVTPLTGAQTVSVGGKYCPNNITVNAIPNQHNDSGFTTIDLINWSKSFAAGWYSNAHGVQISSQDKAATPSEAQQVVWPDDGRVLRSVTVAGDGNLSAGNIKKGVSIFGKTGTWYGNKKEISASAFNGPSSYQEGSYEEFTMPANGTVYYGGASCATTGNGYCTCEIYKKTSGSSEYGSPVDSRNISNTDYEARLTMFDKTFTANAGDTIKVSCSCQARGYVMSCIQAVIVY